MTATTTDPDSRLLRAVHTLTHAGFKFDTRAAIAAGLTMLIAGLLTFERTTPNELWVIYAGIIGWYFPRPAEPTPRA